jgi:chorismate synthase
MQVELYTGPVRRKVEVPRSGHADLVGSLKYGHTDMRNVLERSSARETAMRVAVGATARSFLEELGILVASRVLSIGGVTDETATPADIEELNTNTDRSPVRCLGKVAEKRMIAAIERAKKAGDTLGGTFEVIATGVPVGLGSYAQWDRRLEAAIGRSFLSLNAIKGVDIGLGFRSADALGSRAHDEIFPSRRHRTEYRTNRSGGIDGGMSTGQPIIVHAAMKPLSTLMKPLRSVHLATGKATRAHVERSDACAVPSAAMIGESLLCLDLANAILDKFGGDSLRECRKHLQDWKRETRAK